MKAFILSFLLLFSFSSYSCTKTTVYIDYQKIFKVIFNNVNPINDSELKSDAYFLWLVKLEHAVFIVTRKHKADYIVHINIRKKGMTPDITDEVVKLITL